MIRKIIQRLFFHVLHDQKGGIATMSAIMMLPLMLAVGASIDFARISKCQVELQDAADAAALSGAAAYTDNTHSSNAATVATNYFNSFVFAKDITASATATVSSGTGTSQAGTLGYEVTVVATGSVSTTLMALASFKSFTLTATAVAMNPIVKPVFIFKSGLGTTGAFDWNSVYAYAVPEDSNGNPQYTTISQNLSNYFELYSNCNSSDTNYSTASRCYGQYGYVIPANQTFPVISATQPIAFMFVNMTAGNLSSVNPYYDYTNQYGSPAGDFNLFSSAYEMAGGPPSQYTNTRTFDNSGVATHYPTSSSNSTPNCSLIVEVVNPNSLPTSPPTTGSCYSDTSTQTGYQYGSQSCAKMAGQTFMYWWNDMGGGQDDMNYIDAYYTVSCTTGNSAVVNNNNTTTATSGVSVILVQ